MVDIFDFRRFEEAMNKIFEEFWGLPAGRMLLSQGGEIGKYKDPFVNVRKPFIDIVETDKEVIATVEMPGLNKEDIDVNLTNDRLEISTKTKHEEEKKGKDYIYRERRSGNYYRSIPLPSSIDSDNALASYNNGILEVKMPKIEIKKKTSVKIEQ